MNSENNPYDLPTFDEETAHGELPFKEIPRDDYDMLETFLESRWNSDNVGQNTYRLYEDRFAHFFKWLDDEDLIADPVQVESSDIVRFAERMRREYADSTIDTLLNAISTFYNYFERRSSDPLVTNPVPAAKEDLGLNVEGRDWPRIRIEEMTNFLSSIHHPRDRAEILSLAKFGLRVGEIHNIDLQDINIDYAPLNQCDYYSEIDIRPELYDRPDAIYIDSDIEVGVPHRGEVRKEAVKRTVDTYLPIDGELKHALVRWLAARPRTNTQPADPLFTGRFSQKNQEYHRHSTDNLRNRLKERTDEWGWNDRDGDDITPHFFRHYFTTHHRLPMDALLIDYIRGDSLGSQRSKSPDKGASGKAKEDYTHEDWLNIKQDYLDSVYTFDLPTLSVVET